MTGKKALTAISVMFLWRASSWASPFVRLRCERSRLLVSLHQHSKNDDDTKDFAQYEKQYLLQGAGKATSVDISTSTGHAIRTDIPKSMGGKDTAPQPVELLLASWMGCTQATALFVGRHLPQRIAIDRLEFIDIRGVRDERGSLELPVTSTPTVMSRLKRISGTIRVFTKHGAEIPSDILALLKEQTELRCPVANMIAASGCTIDVDWKDGSND